MLRSSKRSVISPPPISSFLLQITLTLIGEDTIFEAPRVYSSTILLFFSLYFVLKHPKLMFFPTAKNLLSLSYAMKNKPITFCTLKGVFRFLDGLADKYSEKNDGKNTPLIQSGSELRNECNSYVVLSRRFELRYISEGFTVVFVACFCTSVWCSCTGPRMRRK